MTSPLRIAINCQLSPGGGRGGVETFAVALVKMFGQLTDGDEQYVIIGPRTNTEWLAPLLGPNQQLVQGIFPREVKPAAGEKVKRSLGPLRPLARAAVRSFLSNPAPASRVDQVLISNGFYERLGCDVIHFPFQYFEVCALPMIFNPHDLMHRHFPQYFSPEDIYERETIYPAACHFAHTVAVGSQWIKDDILRQYNLHPDKVQVIPFSTPPEAYGDLSPDRFPALREKHQVKMPFAIYSSVTWEHKNHIRLLEAVAALRDRKQIRVNLVCTGSQKNRFFPKVEQRLIDLKLQDQVRFLGHIPFEELRALYRMAQFVVSPSLFEAASGALYEGWLNSVPVACSNVTSVPCQAGDAALLFDPYSVDAIAEAMARMSTDAALREELVRLGARRLQDFSWERSAKAYRALYRRVAHRPLTEEDRWLLSWDWMREPNKKREGGA